MHYRLNISFLAVTASASFCFLWGTFDRADYCDFYSENWHGNDSWIIISHAKVDALSHNELSAFWMAPHCFFTPFERLRFRMSAASVRNKDKCDAKWTVFIWAALRLKEQNNIGVNLVTIEIKIVFVAYNNSTMKWVI